MLDQVLAVPATRTIREIATEVALGPPTGCGPIACCRSTTCPLMRLVFTARITVLGANVLERVGAGRRIAVAC